MVNPKKTVISVVGMLLLGFIIGALMPKSYSGEEQMQKAISQELNSPGVEIFDTVTKGDKKFVGYSCDGYSYALFNKKTDGTFELSEVKRADKLAERAEDIFVDNTGEYLVIVSNNTKLSKIFFKADSGTEKDCSVWGNPSISIIDLPKEAFNGEYTFSDSHGIPIK